MISPQNKVQAATEDRQRVLDEVCRRVLKDFVGRPLTAWLLSEAEGTLRQALGEAVRAGNYVLPDGLVLDRVELGHDMRIKVLFKTAAGVSMSENAVRVIQRVDELIDVDDQIEMKLKDRFAAVAAEIDDNKDLI